MNGTLDSQTVTLTEKYPVAVSRWKQKLVLMSLLFTTLLTIPCFAFWYLCLRMPGESYTRANRTGSDIGLKPTVYENPQEEDANEKAEEVSVEEQLRSHVVHLAETIGERNLGQYDNLCQAADYVEGQLTEFGYTTSRQTFQVRNLDCFNIEAEIKGKTRPEEIVIIGGHYDSFIGTPGANDNGTGTAGMMVLANHFREFEPERTLRFVAWTNEEPPYFQNRGQMGSWVYAEKCRKEEQKIVAVLSLETMGFFTDEEDSQKYPAPLNLLYPSTGNFVGFVSDLSSRQLQRQVIKKFREHAEIPSEGASLPQSTTGVGWSDHWSFWQEGYVGLMVTDTAPFRYPHYHKATDTADKINFPEMAKVIDGLVFVIEDLVKVKAEN